MRRGGLDSNASFKGHHELVSNKGSKIRMNPIIRVPNFKKRGGLVPVVVQEEHTGSVLMLVYARKKEFLETLRTGEAVFYFNIAKEAMEEGRRKER